MPLRDNVTVPPRQGYRVNPISLSEARDLLRFRRVLTALRRNAVIVEGSEA